MNLEPIQLWAAIGVLLLVAIALYTDLKWRRIPNSITVPSLVIALVLQTMFGSWEGLLTGLGGFATGFGILLLLWLTGGGGGGDVKLMGAAGAWVGAMPILMIFIGSALFAVGCTMVMMIRQRSGSPVNAVGAVGAVSASHGQQEQHHGQNHGQKNPLKQSVPYALPMGMATVCVVAFLMMLEG